MTRPPPRSPLFPPPPLSRPGAPAAIATLTARASASASQSSSRRDMAEHRIGCGPECLVGGGVAGHGAEYVAVQTGHEIGERRATRLVEARFAHAFGRGLRRMDRERPLLFQLQQQGDKNMPQRLGGTSGAAPPI